MGNKNDKERGLGKGIGSILGGISIDDFISSDSPSRIKEQEFAEIKIDLIDANPWQPRSAFETASLNELAESIQQQGLIQPITVRKTGNRYQLIAGERRLRACKIAGMDTITAYVRTASDMQMLEMGLMENIQREDLNPIEIALSFKRLLDECGIKQEELSKKVSKSRPVISNYLRLLNLPMEIQKAIYEKQITMGHAKMLVAIDNEETQLEIVQKIIKNDLSVRQVEELVKNLKETQTTKYKVQLPAAIVESKKILSEKFNAKVSIRRDIKGKGSISIAFQSNSDLKRILALLKK